MNKTFFSQKLQEIRLSAGLTQEELGNSLGVSRFTVLDWESGKRTPTLEMLYKLANVLHCPLGYFLDESDDQSPVSHEGHKQSQATTDLEDMIRDLAHDNPDIVVLLRDTRKHWNDYSDLDKQFISDSIALALGRTNADMEKRLKKESKDGPL